MNKTINVLIVDDSQVSIELLTHIIEKDSQLKIIGVAKSGLEVLELLKTQSPDVITMDIHMPIMDGFEVTRRIMETHPIPIVVITSASKLTDTTTAFRAMEAGALAVLEKPIGFSDKNYSLREKEIINTIKTVAPVKLITKRRLSTSSDIQPPFISEKKLTEVQAIAIGASLGGPPAIAHILSQLPSSFPVPIFIVQHISDGFVEGFVNWLQHRCKIPIKLGYQDEVAIRGHVYIAPDGFHMEVKKNHVISLDSGLPQIPKPSIGRLFHSMAEAYGSHGVGVILTGMGKDGVQDLLLMKQKGAYTIAQDEKSCVMFGMPHEAIEVGAIKQVLHLDKIASALIGLTS